MIKNNSPLSMAESLEYIEADKSSEKNAKDFIKKFVKLTPKEAKELRKKITNMGLMKMSEDIINY